MTVFVTGATGTLGRPVVKRLVAAGHQVRALARSAANEPLLRQLGADPVRADLFDTPSLESAVSGCETVLHLATKIPTARQARRRAAWRENDRIRTEGTSALVDVAARAGVETVVYPSVSFTYPDRGAEWIDSRTPIEPASAFLWSTVAAEEAIARFTERGRRGIVLRMGFFYGPTAPNTLEALALARRGFASVVGPAGAFLSQVWVEDAAAAVVAALKSPAGVYDVVDDEPLIRSDVAIATSFAVGRTKLFIPPTWMARLVGGRDIVPLTRSQRVSNRRFKEASGWTPSVPDARDGWARIALEHGMTYDTR